MGMILTTFESAEGVIEARADQQQRLQEITNRLSSGEFHVPTDSLVASKCIDGRPGAISLAPNAAGGTESLMVADDLTDRRFSHADDTTRGHYQNTLTHLIRDGYPVGGHTDTHAHDDASGCGANDRLPLIYDYITRRGDELRALTESLSVSVTDEMHTMIVRNAAQRNSFSTGAELLSVLTETAGRKSVDLLEGAHNEVAAVINLRTGTTLNRTALAAEFGVEYQAFNVDAWSFIKAAKAISMSSEEADRKVVAMVYYNLATAGVLCGQAMRIIILR